MSSFLAFCENPKCGAVFAVPNIVGGPGNVTINMVDSKAGPCPACGAYGQIPNGVYKYANHAVSLLTGPESTVRILRQVHQILKNAKLKTSTKAEILKQVENVSPSTAQALQNTPEISNYLQWLTVLIALVALSIQVHSTYFNEDDIEKQFRDHLLQENKELIEKNNKVETYKRPTPKIQRNEPCPCGSGKKYKKCCLIAQS